MTAGPLVDLIIGGCTIVLSLAGSAFISGTRWGRVEADMKSMSDRLAKIEGMFTLTFREPRELPDAVLDEPGQRAGQPG